MAQDNWLTNAEAVFALMRGGPVTYFSKGAKLWGGSVRTPQALARAMERLDGQDFYINFNLAPRVRLRAGRKDITEWRHVLIDLDPTQEDPPNADCREWAQQMARTFRGRAVGSGRGLQVWLPLAPHVFTSDEERRAAERGVGWWLRQLEPPEGWRVDLSCSDLPHLARMPGTVNTKSSLRAGIIGCTSLESVSDLTSGVTNAVSSSELLAKGWQLEQAHRPPSQVPEAARDDPWKLLPHLTQIAQDVYLEGAETGERHRSLFALGRSLADVGVPMDDGAIWLERANSRCRQELDSREVERIVRSVWR